MTARILLVEDEPNMARTLAKNLERAGHEVEHAPHGEAALARLDVTSFDVVLTDLKMPVMDGIEFIRQLRTRPATKYVPVLMVTTENQANKRQEGKAAGATGWIVKPFALLYRTCASASNDGQNLIAPVRLPSRRTNSCQALLDSAAWNRCGT